MVDIGELRSAISVDGLLGPGPPFLAQLAVHRSHLDASGAERHITVTAAGCGLDTAAATARCWGEVVERVVGSDPATIRRVVTERDEAPAFDDVPWQAFGSYDPETARRLAAEVPLEDDFVCVGRGLGPGRPVLVPASRVVLHWGEFVDGGVAGECDATGLAAGTDPRAAARHGLCEVLERDAIMRAWRDPRWRGRPVDQADLSAPLASWLAATGFGLRLVDVARASLDPVVVAVLSDVAGATVGSACRHGLAQAAEAAVLEAAMLRSTVDVLGPGRSGDRIETSLDHVRFGYRNPGLLQGWLDRIESGPLPTSPDRTVPLVERVGDLFGNTPLVVDLADAHDAPLAVVRVLLPGAMRKEWRHDLHRCRSSVAHRGAHRACHHLPHPFG